MRGASSSSSKQSNRRSTEIDRPKTKEDPPLSSAYILNPVNQVTHHPKSPIASPQDQLQAQPQRPKRKQARRRLHSSRPYQQKLLNTAEARKEIVAALKLHRAAMQQASRQQQPSHTLQLDPPRDIYQSNSLVPSYNQPSPLFPSFTSSFSPGDCTPTSPLPIGLNLNLQSLIDIVTPMFGNSGMHHSLLSHSTSSSSNYSSSSLPSASTDFTDDAVAARLHPAMNMPAGLSDHKAGKDGSGSYLCLDHSLDEFLQDVPLPCLDIAAAEMLEGEWLS